eukprot:Pgem_evm1s4109
MLFLNDVDRGSKWVFSDTKLKNFITDTERIIEYKGVDPMTVTQALNFILCSNYDDPIKFLPRRLAAFKSTNIRLDKAYFDKLNTLIDDDMVMSQFFSYIIKYYSMSKDAKKFDLNNVPKTEAYLKLLETAHTQPIKFMTNLKKKNFNFERLPIRTNRSHLFDKETEKYSPCFSDYERTKMSLYNLHLYYLLWCDSNMLNDNKYNLEKFREALQFLEKNKNYKPQELLNEFHTYKKNSNTTVYALGRLIKKELGDKFAICKNLEEESRVNQDGYIKPEPFS